MKACLFDLDGTLVDSEPLWANALRLSLQDIGLSLGKEKVDELVYGRSWLDIYGDLSRLFPGRCPNRSDLEEKIDYYFSEAKLSEECLLPSSIALLTQLAGMVPVAIVSGSSRQMVGEWIEELGIRPHVAFSLGCEDYPAGKPDPCCYRMAAEHLSVLPEDCLVFEDSEAGVQAAKSAGMCCVALQRQDALLRQDLSAADRIANDLAELDPSGLIEQQLRFGERNE